MKRGILNILIYLFLPSIIYILLYSYMNHDNIYIISILISYIFLTIYFTYKYRDELKKNLINFKKKYFLIIIIYWLLGFGFMILSNYIINYIILPNNISNNEASNRELLYNNKIIYSFLLCIIIPYIEEICFRLEFKKNIKKKKNFLIISSLLFSLMHIINISSLIEIIYIVPYFILGMTFSLIYYNTDNIYSNILAHIIHNSITVIILLI